MGSAAERREELKAVWRQAQACTKCPQLAAARQTVVFGSGHADADLMFVGEAPGANEDKQGLPFVGQAGRLLDTLLEEIGLTRGDVFVANVLKCRPPGNRDPLPQEIDACQDYLFRQIELIEPRVSPISSSSVSSRRPAWPTNGRPWRSSLAPGASPMNMRSASALPDPNTTVWRVDASCGHLVQSRACCQTAFSSSRRSAAVPIAC